MSIIEQPKRQAFRMLTATVPADVHDSSALLESTTPK
jgi:hypothetical protein